VPIKSYLAYSVTGRRDALARALAALGGCEVIPASNRDVLVLVTDTPDDDAIDKGIGTIIPGFVPEPWGKIPRYSPTWVELTVTAGLWALGAFVFTVLAKAAIPVELGRSRWRAPAGPRG
jgi:hypothetical protein